MSAPYHPVLSCSTVTVTQIDLFQFAGSRDLASRSVRLWYILGSDNGFNLCVQGVCGPVLAAGTW